MRPSDFKTARKKLGLTQSQLAAQLGLTRRQVINLEAGKTPIRRAYALILDRAVMDQLSVSGATGLDTEKQTQ